MKFLFFAIFFMVLNPVLARAEESLIKEDHGLIKTQAIVQFFEDNYTRFKKDRIRSEGEDNFRNFGPQFQFKALYHDAEEINLNKGYLLKFKTREQCVAVIYEKGKVLAPDKDKNEWQIEESSARWICPGSAEQLVRLDGTLFKLKGSEILYSNKKMVAFKGPLLYKTGEEWIELKENTVYERVEQENKTDYRATPEDVTQTLTWEKPLRTPKESIRSTVHEKIEEIAEEPDNNHHRFALTPAFGTGEGQNLENGSFSIKKGDANGARISYHYGYREPSSWIFRISFLGIQTNSAEKKYSYGPGQEANSVEWNMVDLSVGKRYFIHQNDHYNDQWGWYWLFGLNSQSLRINKQAPGGGMGGNFGYFGELSGYGASLSFGSDYYFRVKKTFGLQVGGELDVIHSGRWTRTDQNKSGPVYNAPGETAPCIGWAFLITLGPSIQF